MRFRWALVIGAVCIACSSSSDEVDRERCTQLRDQLITLRLKGLEASAGMDVAAHRAALQQSMGDDFIAACVRTLSAAQIRCALSAEDLATAETCDHASVANK